MKARGGRGNCSSGACIDGLVALTIFLRNSRRPPDVRRQRDLSDLIENLFERTITLKTQNARAARRETYNLCMQRRSAEFDSRSDLESRARPQHRFPNQRLDLSHQQHFYLSSRRVSFALQASWK